MKATYEILRISTQFSPRRGHIMFVIKKTCLRCSKSALPQAFFSLPCVWTRASSSTSRWKQRQGRDAYARDARVQGLKSRAAFKLIEVRINRSNDGRLNSNHTKDIADRCQAQVIWERANSRRSGKLTPILTGPMVIYTDNQQQGYAPGSWSQASLNQSHECLEQPAK